MVSVCLCVCHTTFCILTLWQKPMAVRNWDQAVIGRKGKAGEAAGHDGGGQHGWGTGGKGPGRGGSTGALCTGFTLVIQSFKQIFS